MSVESLSFRKVWSRKTRNRERAGRDDWLKTKTANHSKDLGDVYRNQDGFEIRSVSPYSCLGLKGVASLPSPKLVTWHGRDAARWELFDPQGRLLASEPRFIDALHAALPYVMAGRF